VNFSNSCVGVNLYYDDYQEICRIFDEFNGGTTLLATDILKLLSTLSKIGVSGIEDVKSLIKLISRFGVKRSSNFDLFLDNIAKFNMGKSTVNIMAITKFVNDMIRINMTYATNEGTTAVNNIINYFVKFEIPLRQYYSGSPGTKINITNECEIIIPANFPSLLVNSLYEYSNQSTKYGNVLYDVQMANLLNSVPICDRIIAIQQAYMLCNNLDKYNNIQSVIIPNVTLIISFFYKEEVNAISNGKNNSNFEKRVSMMTDIAKAISKYAEELNTNESQHTAKLYVSIANVFKTFPALSFQYMSNDIISKCGNGNCVYDKYVDPNYSLCKASTERKSINYRSNPPVV
jgi:hypothetical protein